MEVKEGIHGVGSNHWSAWTSAHPDPATEAALRAARIVRVHQPSTGFLTGDGITALAIIEPIHLVRHSGVWKCILGWELLREAQRVLQAPRLFPVCIHADTTIEELREYLIVEQVGVPLRHQMDGDELHSLVDTFLAVVKKNTHLFLQLGADQWTRIMGRRLRWLRYHTATAKVRKIDD